jgi:hypothetical protein
MSLRPGIHRKFQNSLVSPITINKGLLEKEGKGREDIECKVHLRGVKKII